MKKLVMLLVTLCLMAALVGCGGGSASDDPNLGTYVGTTGKAYGMEVPITDFFGEGFFIELRANGKCKITVDTETAVGKWTLDGDKFTVKGGGIECEGTLADGVMLLENVMDAGVDLTLINENYAGPKAETDTETVPVTETEAETEVVPGTETEAETEAVPVTETEAETEVVPVTETASESEAAEIPEGALRYTIKGYIVNGEEYGEDMVETTGMEETYLQFQEDGKAVLCVQGQEFEVNWDEEGNLTMYGTKLYSFEKVSDTEIHLTLTDDLVCILEL